MSITSEEFLTFEDEVQRLAQLAGPLYPCVAAGGARLFGSLASWFGRSTMSIVLPDPRLNLALPYPREELSIALSLGSGTVPADEDVLSHAKRFGVEDNLLDREIINLSGGERMLVSLCKNAALAGSGMGAVVCSPYFWLDRSNRPHVDRSLDQHDRGGSAAHLLTLCGEADDSFDTESPTGTPLSTVRLVLHLDTPTVAFRQGAGPRAQETILRFGEKPQIVHLSSPAVITGPNGVGKTTLAKLLTGILAPTYGSISVSVRGYGGRARLLLQDSLLHLFSLSPRGHLLRVFAHDEKRRSDAIATYEAVEKRCAASIDGVTLTGVVGDKDRPASLLQAKIALSVERLCTPTPLLILDEPGWCLSKPFARVYLTEVVREAHSRGTAVLLISHQDDWWSGITRSRLSLGNARGHVSVKGNEL